jgi:hypothetical protein
LYYATAKYGYALNILKLFYKPAISGLVMALPIIYLKFLPILYLIPLAALVYFASLFILKGIGKDEINLMKSFIGKKNKNNG